MYEIVHLFPCEKFTQGFIDFIEAEFEPENHLIIVYGAYPGVTVTAGGGGNVLFVDSIFKLLPGAGGYRHLAKAQKIFLHSLSGPAAQLMTLLPWLWKKLYIYFWGYEIYGFERKKPGLRNALYRFCIATLARHAKYILTILAGDVEVLRRHVDFKGGTASLRYGGSIRAVRQSAAATPKAGPPWHFLLGNNATLSNNHAEILQKLAAYANCPMKVYTPLSYGDDANREVVLAQGKTLLGDRFAPLTGMLPLEEYHKLVAGCSVAFFNNDRQQALGNIFTVLGSGGKLYLRRGTALWQELAEQQGFKVFDIAAVGQIPFEELLYHHKNDAAHNQKRLEEYLSPERLRQSWAAVFDME